MRRLSTEKEDHVEKIVRLHKIKQKEDDDIIRNCGHKDK